MKFVGIIGHRSWIARALSQYITTETDCAVVPIEKHEAGHFDSSGYLCLYVIPGRTNPTANEMAAELELVSAVVNNPKTSRRVVLLSSQSIIKRETDYGRHKDHVEHVFFGSDVAMARVNAGQLDLRAVRPGAVFGPGQDIDSQMLIPSIARTDGSVELTNPDKPTQFIHIDFLVSHMWLMALACLNGHVALTHDGAIPGTITATPRQMLQLYNTWKSLKADQ